MTKSLAEARLRRCMRWAAGAVFVATPLELVLAEHTESAIQLFPFAAAALGVSALVALNGRAAWVRLGRGMLVVVGLVSLLGMWEHLEHNYAFEREIRPTLEARAVAWHALFGGAPAIAPGILLLGAFLAWSSGRGAAR